MNEFDARWQRLAAVARRLPPAAPAELPFAFLTRLQARLASPAPEAWAELLSRMGRRALAAAFAGLLIGASLALHAWYDPRLDVPALAPVFTSDLVWP